MYSEVLGKPYVKSLDSWSDLPPAPPPPPPPTPHPFYGSNWIHQIADFVFLPYIYFILAFRDLQCIQRYWETLCEESR